VALARGVTDRHAIGRQRRMGRARRMKGERTMQPEVTTLERLAREARASGTRFHEFLRREALSAGMYILPGGGVDDQVPHREDEIYVVVSGSGSITIAGREHRVGPGSVMFVAAHDEHRFHDFSDDLEILVIFAPAYSGRGEPVT
jgi:mannose-6-phosphate isomerase-like protein (cupin superfamily)